MSPQIQSTIVLVIAAATSIFLMIRLKKWAWCIAVPTTWVVLVLGGWWLAIMEHPNENPLLRPAPGLAFLAVLSIFWCTPIYTLRRIVLICHSIRKKMPVPRSAKLAASLLILVSLMEIPAIIAIPRLAVCYANKKIKAGLADAAALAVKPRTLDLQAVNNAPLISVGYAELHIDPNSITSIRNSGSSVMIRCGDAAVALLPPQNLTVQQFMAYVEDDGFHWPIVSTAAKPPSRTDVLMSQSVAAEMFRQRIEHPFQHDLDCLNTVPLTAMQAFSLNSRESMRYLLRLWSKSVLLMCGGRGEVVVFHGPHIDAIVYSHASQNRSNPHIFARTVPITQGIVINAPDPQQCERVAHDIIASYRFVVTELPSDAELDALVAEHISRHPKLERRTESE